MVGRRKYGKTLVGHACEVCGQPGNGHHIKTIGSGGEDVPDNLMVLCMIHHREIHDHGLNEFVKKYQLHSLMKSKNWAYDGHFGKWLRLTPEGWDD